MRILAELGYNQRSLKTLVMAGHRRPDEFILPGVAEIVARMKSAEEREKCETQIAIVTKYIQDYFIMRR